MTPEPRTPAADVDDLLAACASEHLDRNGVPDAATAADRRRCRAVVLDLLGSSLAPAARLGESPLGAGWTDVFDVTGGDALDVRTLASAGWLRVDRLLVRRVAARGLSTWAVVESGRVLGGVCLRRDGPLPDPAEQVLSRCRARGEVRLREVAELRELRRINHPLPAGSAVISAAADVESGLGGRLLAPWASGRTTPAPASLSSRRRGSRRSRTVVVAISGVDGSGKSSLREALETDLRRAGVDFSTVWVRPGMGLGRLVRLAALGKRVLRQDSAPGIRSLAHRPPDGPRLRSRSGAVGWTWATLVSASFLVGVWRQHLAASGVVIYDRHLLDALATLDFAYEGVDLRLQHALVRALFPRADLRLYLEVPAEVSVTRKPDDVIGDSAVRRQLEAYEHWLARTPPTHRLDATLPADRVAAQALRLLADAGGRSGRVTRRGFPW